MSPSSPIIILNDRSWWRDELSGSWDVRGNWPAFICQTYSRCRYWDMVGTLYGVPVYRERERPAAKERE